MKLCSIKEVCKFSSNTYSLDSGGIWKYDMNMNVNIITKEDIGLVK